MDRRPRRLRAGPCRVPSWLAGRKQRDPLDSQEDIDRKSTRLNSSHVPYTTLFRSLLISIKLPPIRIKLRGKMFVNVVNHCLRKEVVNDDVREWIGGRVGFVQVLAEFLHGSQVENKGIL